MRNGLKVKPVRATDDRPSVVQDGSVWSLVLANLIAAVMALWLDWRLGDLMMVYWVQSVIIGMSYFARISQLDKFSTKNCKITNQSVDPTPKTKKQTAAFFAFHYGVFHFGYLIFIFAEGGDGLLSFGLLICAAAFAVNHFYSYRYHRAVDQAGTPNIGTLMFTPYIRIVPMHLTIVLGAQMSGDSVWFFIALKTVADVIMHQVEHKRIGHRQD